jgi:hypothetical protein
MERSDSPAERRAKRDCVEAREGEWEDTLASQKYTPVLRARGVH